MQMRANRLVERMVELSCFLVGRLPDLTQENSKPEKQRVFYHDPCHLRFSTKIMAEPRQLLRAFPEIELLELPDGPQCCGQGGLFHIGSPLLSTGIRDSLAGKVFELQPDIITTSCSGCLMQWKTATHAAGKKIRVEHLAEVVLELLSSLR